MRKALVFLLILVFNPILSLESSKSSEISLYGNTDDDLKNFQSASEFVLEITKTNTTEQVLQFFGKAFVKGGEHFFGAKFQVVGKIIGVKSEIQAEIEKATKLIIAEIHDLHHTVHHQTHELKAYMDKLNFKDTVVVPLTLTSRAMHNYLKNPDVLMKEELIRMCRQYPPKAVTVNIAQHAFDLLSNLYKSSKFDGSLYDELSSLLFKYFYTAQTVYFFSLGVQYSESDSVGAVNGAREDFLKDQHVLEHKIKRATRNMHEEFVPYFNSSLKTDVIIPFAKQLMSEDKNNNDDDELEQLFSRVFGNRRLAKLILRKLEKKFPWRHFVVIVSESDSIFRGKTKQQGGLRYEGDKTVSVFLNSIDYRKRFESLSPKMLELPLSDLERFDGEYLHTTSAWMGPAVASSSNESYIGRHSFKSIPDLYCIF